MKLIIDIPEDVRIAISRMGLLRTPDEMQKKVDKAIQHGTPVEPKWIPVSEKLPEDGRPVLIYAWNVHHVIARYDSFRTENGYKKCWVTADAWNGNTEIEHKVIAWMPLPKQYEQQERSE